MYGIEAAARVYFDKPARDLTVTEAALLAGLPQAPSAYAWRNQAGVKVRRDAVLDAMVRQGYLTRERAADLKMLPLGVVTSPCLGPSHSPSGFDARVLTEIDDLGYHHVSISGPVITTTLDPVRQSSLLAAGGYLRQEGHGNANLAAMAASDPTTGQGPRVGHDGNR